MAHIKEYADGRARPYEVRWSEYRPCKDGTPKRQFYSESFREKKKAEAFKRLKEDQAASGSLLVDPRAGKAPLSDWAEQWFREYERTVKPSTARKSRGLLDATILPALGHRPARAIRAADVAEWLHDIEAERGISPATVKHHYLVLRAVLQYAAQNGAIAANPAVGVRLPTNRTRGRLAHKPHFLTAEQVQRLADELAYPYDVLVPFMAWTGLRSGEVAGLNVGDVDLDRDVVTVERTRTRAKGGWEMHTPKSGERREVPVGAVRDELVAYLARHPYGDDPDAPLWPGRKITGRTSHGNVSAVDYDAPWDRGPFYRRHFQPALKVAGLPATVRLHDLRHTFASLCAANGIKPEQVADWMGHRNVTVTLTIYTHLFKQDTAQAASALAAARRSSVVGVGQNNVVPLHPAG